MDITSTYSRDLCPECQLSTVCIVYAKTGPVFEICFIIGLFTRQPEQHLWSCDDKGNVYFLSSWEAGWRRLRANRGVQLRVKRVVACAWCVWVIGVDQSPYLLVPFDGTTIRVAEVIMQHERWNPSSGFSSSNLTAKDPPEYQQVGCDTYSWTDLPSTRWQWESSEWEYMLEHSEDRAGWEYSTSFGEDAIFSSFYQCDCVVRRRRWQRVRRFLGHDRWLLCGISSDDLTSQSGQHHFSNKGIVHVHRLAIGGQAIPCQLIGFFILWVVTKDGRVICRTNVHRNNPEGSDWVERPLLMIQDDNSGKFHPDTHQPFAIDIHANQYGQALVLTDDNQLFYRIGVDFKSPYGGFPFFFLTLGGRNAWLLSNTGRAWFHADFGTVIVPSPSLVKSRRSWAPMSGRLASLSVSSSDQVFALDACWNRLIYRSGISPEAPGGEMWLALDLPILPNLDDDHKLGSCLTQEGPLAPLCVPQSESIQLVSKVLQLTSPEASDSADDGLERLSVPEGRSIFFASSAFTLSVMFLHDRGFPAVHYDPNVFTPLPQLSPAHMLSHRLRKFFTRRSRSQMNSFVSFRRLLINRDALDEKSDASWMSEDQVLPKIGHPPIRLTSLWAGALSSLAEYHLPYRWRIAALLLARKNLIPYFTLNELFQPPEWLLRINSALSSSMSMDVLEGVKSADAIDDCEPWAQTFRVDVLQIPLEDRGKCAWAKARAVITHFVSKTRPPVFSIAASPSSSRASVSEGSTDTMSTSPVPQKIDGKEIAWVGYIDSLSILIPRSLRGICTGGRRKFSDSLPIRKTEEKLYEVPQKTPPLPSVPIASDEHLVAVFVGDERPPLSTTANSAMTVTAESVGEEEAGSATVFEESTSFVRSNIVPRWILRFSSKAEASAWIAETQNTTIILPSTSRVWLVTEQSEIFSAVGTSLDSLAWNRVGGHFARVDSICISAKGRGQVTWALGHDCTPWVYREEWSSAAKAQSRFSLKHFPFKTPHVQADTRQFRVYEFQVRRMLHGYTSSKAFNERGVMWSRDLRHQQLSSLCDIHLPPHKGQVHWLDDWKVDFSTLPGSAPHHTSMVWPSRDEERYWEYGGKESPSYSPRGSPRRGYSMDSPINSPDPAITMAQSQNPATFTVTATPLVLPPSNGDFKEGVVYVGTTEGHAYSIPPLCDKKGWFYASRSSSSRQTGPLVFRKYIQCPCSQSQRSKSSSGMRYRRWVRSCVVRTEAPWQEVGPLRVKCFSLSYSSPISHCVDVWAVTDSGELVSRCDVTPANPGPNPFAYTQKYEEALDLVHGKIRQLFCDPNLVHTPETNALMRDIADEVAYLRFDSTLLTNASPEWSKKFTERELVTQRQAFLDTCTLLTDPGGQLTARYQVNMKPGNRDCSNAHCACIELKKDPNANADIGIGWTDTSRRSAENWAVKELKGLRDELKPLAEEAKKRIRQYLDAYGITDRYAGYHNNLGYICRSENPVSVDPALLNPGRPKVAPRWHMGVEDERAKAVECTDFVAPQDTECERMERAARKCEVKVTCEDPVAAAGIVCKFPGRTEYEDAYIDPPLHNLPSSAKKPPRTHRSVSEQPPGVRGRGPDVEVGMEYKHDKSFGIRSPPRHQDGTSWLHYPTKRRLQFVAAAPDSSSRGLWAVCADFGLMWRLELCGRSVRWCCLGFAPSGAAWHILAPVSARCLWALDVDGQIWVHMVNSCNPAEPVTEETTEVVNWIKVASPRVSDISCSPDGKATFVSSTRKLEFHGHISVGSLTSSTRTPMPPNNWCLMSSHPYFGYLLVMDLFRRYLSQSAEIGEDAGANVIETLVDRLQTATRAEDRRDSMRGIKALSKRYRLEVGTQAMPACIETLSRDSEDSDTVSYALDALCNIMNDARTDMDPQELVNIPPDLGKQFTEIFVKDPENVQLVLSFLSSYDMHLRRQTIQLLILMLQNNRKAVQDLLLNSPMAVSKFMATLCDPMEVIRNDGLLLLLYFTKNHATIQKIVAFENVFERILSIVETETVGDGGVVIEDCFRLLHQLLAGNQQNQILFKDGRFVQRLAKLFKQIPQELEESSTWSAQKLVNVSLLLKIFRTLVSTINKSQNVKSCQEEMRVCGLLTSLWEVVMAGGVPAELLTETLYSLGEMVRGCPTNQEAVVQMLAPSEPPQPAITVLLVTMVNERQQLAVRMAVLYCFQCLLAGNSEIQTAVVSTLLPKHSEPSCVMSAGQLLCGGLFSQDALSAWFSAIALFHSINQNRGLKENLLQVHMAPSSGSGPPVTLMQQCFRLISQAGRVQGKIGLLQFLCAWLSHCPLAVEAFLSLRPVNYRTQSTTSTPNKSTGGGAGSALSHLIADVLSGEGEEINTVSCLSALLIGICVCYNNGAVEDYDSESLMKTIDKRIGIDDLIKHIGQIYRSDEFVRVIKHPVLEAAKADDLVFDYDFTRLFKIVEFEVCARLSRSSSHIEEGSEVAQRNGQVGPSVAVAEGEANRWAHQQEMLLAYQGAVAERDAALQSLQLRVIELERQLSFAHQNGHPVEKQDETSAVDANSDLQMALVSGTNLFTVSRASTPSLSDPQLHSRPRNAKTWKPRRSESRRELEDALKVANNEKATIKSEHEDLLLLLSEQDSQINRLTAELAKLSSQARQTSQQSVTSAAAPQPVQQQSQAQPARIMDSPLQHSPDVSRYPPPVNQQAYSYEYLPDKQQTSGYQSQTTSSPLPPYLVTASTNAEQVRLTFG
ncbi:unnamed protein product [Hydatigera taeniaeformis]|uniref:Peroxin/Ferlin domain-containing protein n=1 Tax=Hydatigena taeniaeformis TaxID=6205 RepID=A0A158RDW5_HYDTA|nr:unnamed protein product [Hydatigera taeniaeformis]